MTDTPSRRAGLRNEIARAIHHYDYDHMLSGNDIPSEHHRGEADAVLAVLYRQWPWLRAEAEDTKPAAAEAIKRPGLRERHHAQWAALTETEQAARIAKLDEYDEPEAAATSTAAYTDAVDRVQSSGPHAGPARHDDGPSVQECAEADRNYDVQQGGE